MKIDKNLTELENLLRLINANNPEINLRADQIKSVHPWMNVSSLYEEKNSYVEIELVAGKGYSGSYRFYYDRVTIQGYKALPEPLPYFPVLLSDTPESILARYAERYEIASDTELFTNYFVPPTADEMFGSISIATDGKSLLYHQSYNVRLMRVNSLNDDLPINRMIGTSTLSGFDAARDQLEIK
ncbi:hypothetical protein D3C77_189570 [compost metagenome]